MPFPATVLPVILASPGDVTEYRAIARTVLHEWNYIHSASTGLVLMPVGWETHSSPELGARPQELINERVLEDCDLLVGIFWTRLGTPTGSAKSGTVEEIHHHVVAGRPAMIYFCEAPAALQTVDQAQYGALVEFRAWCLNQGLVELFLNAAEFGERFRRHLQITLQKNKYLQDIVSKAVDSSGAIFASADDATTPATVPGLAASLSAEAREILVTAAADGESEGTILSIEVLAGRILQIGSKSIGNEEDARTMARWDYGLQQLLTLRLIERSGGARTRRIYRVTHLGFELADRLKPL